MIAGLPLPSDSSIVAAAKWLQAAMFGTIATSVAIVAVAALGFLMLQGQLPIRRSATSILGCCLLFAAPVLVTGLGTVVRDLAANEMPVPQAIHPTPPLPLAPDQNPPGYDPYAGASLVH